MQRRTEQAKAPARPRVARAGSSAPGFDLDFLQRSAGNRAVADLIVQRQPPTTKARQPLRITTTNINDAISIMWKTYQVLVRRRRDAVDALRVAAADDAPSSPSVLKELLLAVAGAALVGPTGMIGTAIAGKLVKVGADLAQASLKAQVTNQAISNAINTGISESLKKAYGAIVDEEGKSDLKSRELFFLSQKEALADESDKTEIYFLNEADTYRRMEARKPGSGISALKVLQQSVLDSVDLAAQAQRQASLDAWLVYQSRKELGESSKAPWFGQDKGTAVEKAMGTGTWGKPAATGGLLVLHVEEPNRSDPRVPLKIKSAQLKGLNAALRKELTKRPLGELAISMVAWCHDGVYHRFSIGINEGQVGFVSTAGNPYARNALLQLSFRAWPHLLGVPEAWKEGEAELRKNADLAGEIIFERELSGKKLSDDELGIADNP
jgi:hypothetical protein